MKYVSISENPGAEQGKFDGAYVVAYCEGQRSPVFDSYFNEIGGTRTGFIFQPSYVNGMDTNDLASGCLYTLQDYNADRNKDMPVIIDPYFGDLDFDQVRAMIDYMQDPEKKGYPDLKVLIRCGYKKWNNWYAENKNSADVLLTKADILSVDFNEYPNELLGVGMPKWVETFWGYYEYCTDWEKPVVEEPVVEEPVIEVPITEEEPVIEEPVDEDVQELKVLVRVGNYYAIVKFL